MSSIMELAVGAGVVTIIALVIFYAVYDGANRDSWSTSVTSIIGLIPLGVSAVALVLIVRQIA